MVQMFAFITLVAIVIGVFNRPVRGMFDASLVCDIGICFASPFYSFFWMAGAEDKWLLRDAGEILDGNHGSRSTRASGIPCFLACALGLFACMFSWFMVGFLIWNLICAVFKVPFPPSQYDMDNDASLGGGH
jgi:hypothetical protein